MRASITLVALATLAACTPTAGAGRGTTAQLSCPRELPGPPLLPLARPEHLLAGFWLERAPEPERALLDTEAIEAHNRRVEQLTVANAIVARVDLSSFAETFPRERIAADIARLDKAIAEGKRVLRDGRRPKTLVDQLRARLAATKAVANELRVALRGAPLRCYPEPRGLYESRRDLAFDLAQCAELRFGEAVRVLGRGPRYSYVQAAYGGGWVRSEVLSAALDSAQTQAYLKPSRPARVIADRVGVWSAKRGGKLLGIARLGLLLPLAAQGEGAPPRDSVEVHVPSAKGLTKGWIRDRRALAFADEPLSRRALWQRAFQLLHTPYGWGGVGGKRDCSRLLMDVFASFGVRLPRNSRQQSKAGTEQIDVSKLDEAKKRAAIEAAGRRGIVVLYLPGHIMLYLGRDGEHLYALHQFSGYLTPCVGGGETMHRVNRTAVTALELGRGSSRRAFIERITRLVLFAPPAAPRPR